MLGLGGLWENAGWREARRGRNTDTLLLSRQQQSQFSACSSCPKRIATRMREILTTQIHG